MKKITLFLMILSFFSYAKTRDEQKNELKSGLSNFANKTIEKKSSEKKKKKKKKKKSSSYSSNSKYSTSSTNSKPVEINFKWLWNVNSEYDPKKKERFTLFRHENTWMYAGVSYDFQNWEPTGINNAKTDTTTIEITKFEASALFNLIYMSYETTFNHRNLDKQRQLIKIRKDSVSDWERFIASISPPIVIMLGKHPFARPYFTYDKQVFMSTVTLNEDKYFVPRDEKDKPGDEELQDGYYKLPKGSKIVRTTLFKDYSFGIKAETRVIDATAGIFYMYYNKPYSLTIDGEQYDAQIYDTDFSALGGFFGLKIFFDNVYLGGSVKFGGGNINFAGINTSLKDIIDDKYNILYTQLNGELGFRYLITKFIKFDGILKLETRGFSLTEKGDNENSDSLELNTDTILSAFVRLSFSIDSVIDMFQGDDDDDVEVYQYNPNAAQN